MFEMKKTVYGSKFVCFEEGSRWYKCAFREKPISPEKVLKKWVYERCEDDYSKCDEISIIQIQRDGKDFLIEYVIL